MSCHAREHYLHGSRAAMQILDYLWRYQFRAIELHQVFAECASSFQVEEKLATATVVAHHIQLLFRLERVAERDYERVMNGTPGKSVLRTGGQPGRDFVSLSVYHPQVQHLFLESCMFCVYCCCFLFAYIIRLSVRVCSTCFLRLTTSLERTWMTYDDRQWEKS